MTTQRLEFAGALLQAQQLGFAESDPSLDVDGIDALNKLVIITLHAFGTHISPAKVFCTGISSVSSGDIRLAGEKGRKIKLVGQIRKNPDDTLSMYVIPKMVTPEKYIYNVEDEFNGVVIKGAYYYKQFMFGMGAGGYPTGSAVLSDITALGYNYRYEYKKAETGRGLKLNNETALNVYLRYNDKNILKNFRFDEIRERYYSEGFMYVIGSMTINNLQKAKNSTGAGSYFLAEY